MNRFVVKVPSPLGWLRLEAEGEVLTRCTWCDEMLEDSGAAMLDDSGVAMQVDNIDVPECITAASRQLEAYFRSELKSFDLPIRLSGTQFQKTVWHRLSLISYGTTISYSTLASLIGNPKAVRAVAQACHRNPLAIIIPCHRVIGANGSLTGYAAGVERKQGLLNIEKSISL